jgi:SAM-dependent methyltransferase
VTNCCPLCSNSDTVLFHTLAYGAHAGRQYWHCNSCWLVFVPPAYQLSEGAEEAFYQTHQNDPADMGYRGFLSRATEPLLALLKPASTGLDFGCGPAPTLSQMLSEQGHRCADYDYFFAQQPDLLEQQYDFITCTEVIEHLSQPAQVLSRLRHCLKPGGLLVVMTQHWISQQRFSQWNYRNDPTHIGFYHQHTMRWIANHWHFEICYQQRDVVIFQRKID